MNIVASTGNKDIAMVYVVGFDGHLVECVEAVQPPVTREEKWVVMISTLFGCPIGCKMCDAGGHYRGKLSMEEMAAQIEYLIATRFPEGHVPSQQFKIQLARMGEPALNPQVLDLLEVLPKRISAPGLMPSFSTVAPHGRDAFFDHLIEIKNTHYPQGRFQFQFSMHTTDETLRKELVPVRTWDFRHMADFGRRYYREGDRKITLNFALAENSPIEIDVLNTYFDPDIFLIKITPLNPTYQAQVYGLSSYFDGPQTDDHPLLDGIQSAGYEVILSVGELEENEIGSNCGQYVQRHLKAAESMAEGYTYQVLDVDSDARERDSSRCYFDD